MGDSRDANIDGFKPRRIDGKLRFVRDPAEDAVAELSRGHAGGGSFVKRFSMVGGEEGVALEVAEENAAAGFEDSRRAFEDAGEIGGVREILGDGVDNDGVEGFVRYSAEVIGGAVEKFHLRQRVVFLERIDGDF